MSCLINNKDMLAKNARLMIGMVFIFALIWKAFLSPDFMDSRFFELNMIEDPRFSEFTKLSCNVDSDALLEFRDYVKQHIDGRLINPEVSSFNLECLSKIAYFLSYYTLTIESIIAMLFLLPANLRITNYRDYFLILFCISIYSVATVEGFGWLLISMGISQCDESKKMKIIYLTSFLILLIYSQVPVINILLGHL